MPIDFELSIDFELPTDNDQLSFLELPATCEPHVATGTTLAHRQRALLLLNANREESVR